MIEKVCPYCNKKINVDNGRVFSNHVRWCEENKTNGDKGISKLGNKRFERISVYKKCEKCSSDFVVERKIDKNGKQIISKKEKKFCCLSCANYRENQKAYYTEEIKAKLSFISKDLWMSEDYRNKQANTRKYFSSKREREIVLYFKEKFPDDEWTSGGGIKVDGHVISRDMYSNKLKICFEYDGIWHFKDIHNQLKSKQEKDSLLEKWCCDNGYRLVRIDEDEKLSFEDIEHYIYNESLPIIKIGNRYISGMNFDSTSFEV